jgi:hypothetical protein
LGRNRQSDKVALDDPARQLPLDKVREAVQIARGVRNMAIAIADRRIERDSSPGGAGEEEPVSCVCR